MIVRYSYDDFTTKGHGVIEYTNPYSNEDGKKHKRRLKNKSKFSTRWPSAAPMKFKTASSKAITNKSIQKQAQEIYKQRFPGQQPKKGQIKIIIQELRKTAGKSKKQKGQKPRINNPSNAKNNKSDPTKKVDELAATIFKRRFPGQKPHADQLKEIRQEVINARKKIGL